MTRTTAAGIAELIGEEGEALHAYRDVTGTPTIGVGLTAASGVIVPKLGMVITKDESRRLLGLALERNYEPAVAAAIPGATPQEFDGGVSFHFNTGRIGTASWPDELRAKNADGVRAGLLKYVTSKGKRLPGLVRRRTREADVILLGKYAFSAGASSPAALKLGSTGPEVVDLQTGLIAIGVLAGPASGIFDAATNRAVRAVQAAHPNLIVDGIAGPATRAAIQRERDLKTKVATGTVVGTAATAAPPTASTANNAPAEAIHSLGLSPLALAAIIAAIAVCALLFVAWRYRDELTAISKRVKP